MAKTDSNGFPARNTANPTIGGQRCECGDIRTIHQSKGKRANFFYSVCSTCGTDQRTGSPVQAKFKAYYPTMAALIEAEQAVAATVTSDPVTQNKGTDTSDKEKLQSQPKETPPTLPTASGESRDSEETAVTATSGKASTASQTEATSETEKEPKKAGVGWGAVLCGVVLGGLTGGAIIKLS